MNLASAVLIVLAACGSAGCKAFTSTPDGGPPPIAAPGVDLGVCILEQAAGDTACRPTGGNAVTCAEDIARACGSDVASVVRILTAHRRLMVADDAGVK